MTTELTPLQRMWMALNYEYQKTICDDDAQAFDFAMYDTRYEPIDTKFCMVQSDGLGWMLLVAQGHLISHAIECGDMESGNE